MESRTNHVEAGVTILPGSMHETASRFAKTNIRTTNSARADLSSVVDARLNAWLNTADGFRILAAGACKPMRTFSGTVLALSLIAIAHGQADAITAVHAAIQEIDSTTRTIVVKTDDGGGRTLHFTDSTAVHGGEATDVGSKDSWHGLKAGGEVVVHYTELGTEGTAVEIDKIGEGGLKTTKGTVKDIDREENNLVVVAGDGTEETFRLTGQATKDAEVGVGKGSRVTVYYIEKTGKKVARFWGQLQAGHIEKTA